MIGAVSLNPYVSSYQYNVGSARMRTSASNMQIQPAQSASAVSGSRAVSTGRSGGVSSLIGARSIAAAGQASAVAGVSAGRRADPESPVEPVDAVSVLQPSDSGSTNYSIPFLRKGMDPAELAVRMRIQYGDTGAAEGSRGAGQDDGKFDLPGSSRKAGADAAQFDLPGSSREAGADAAQFDLPGSSREAGADAAQLNLPGSSQEKGADAVGLDLPGDSQAAEEAVQIDLPGTPAEEAEQLGLPGTQTGKAAEAGLPGDASETESQGVDDGQKADMPEIAGLKSESAQETAQEVECQTCKERKYQDGSNDPGVSFKTPTHIGPEQSASAVLGHEMEHVVRERAKAQSEGRRVISQSVTMQTGICPECGRVYTAGGVTRTTTAAENKPEQRPTDRWFCAPAA